MKRVAVLIVVIFLCAATTYGAGQKIAVIDMEKVFTEYYKTKISDGNLKKQAEIYRTYAEKLKDSLMKLQEEYKEIRDASLNVALSDTERESKRLLAQEKYRQVLTKEAELKQYDREKQTHLKEEFEKMRNRILSEIKKEVNKRCAIEGYTIVLDRSGRTLNNIPVIVHANSSCDITEPVLEELNRGHKAPEKKPEEEKKQ